MLYVGIDWADDHHDVAITDDSAKTLGQFQISHDTSGFAVLHDQIKGFNHPADQVLVAIETARGLLVHECLCSGYSVYAINPKAVNRYKDRYVFSQAKSDSLDALALAHLLRTDRHRFRPLRPLPEDYRLLDRLCQDLRKLVNEKTRVSSQISSVLKEYYPKALELVSVDSQIGVSFLRSFPDPEALQACGKQEFLLFFKKHRYSWPARVEGLWARAQGPSPRADGVVLKAGRLRLLVLLDQLAALREHVTLYEKQIQAILDKLPEAESISTLPGVGNRLGAELTAALGPKDPELPDRFESAQQIMKLSGSVPVTRQSGQWRAVQVRYGCARNLRRTFHDWAFASLSRSVWARAYYDFYKAMNRPHSTILRNLAKKWTKILFVLWSEGTTYDESLHIENLKKRNVPWAVSL